MDMALEEAASGAPVFTVGQLIHNPQGIEALAKRGVTVLDEQALPDDFSATTFVIRAHGITPSREAELRAYGAKVIDATCPIVKKNQLYVRALFEDGFRIFLAGERQHAEITGILGYAPCTVVENGEEAKAAAETLYSKEPDATTALVGQTTISTDEYLAIGSAIQALFPALQIVDTICSSTQRRQAALQKLCTEVDAVIIAGGRASANTRRLFSIAARSGKPAWLIESAAEIPAELAAYPRIGLSAGASTPDEIIDEIEIAVQNRSGH
jgi:4-hydroxy-3-methylbut-2-enyl diphosphate reductase